MGSFTKRDFNLAAKIILGLSMLALAIGFVTSLINFTTYSKLGIGANPNHFLIEAIMDVLLIVAALLIFNKNKYGLIAFIVLGIVRMFVTIPSGTDISYAYYLGGKTTYFIRDIGVFCIAMCFRKNGISGWRAFFASDDYIANHYLEKDASKQEILNDDSISTPEAVILESHTNKASVSTKKEAIKSADVEATTADSQTNEAEQANSTKVPIKKSGKIGLIASYSLLGVIAILLLFIVFKPYPENISGFSHKFKKFFGLPDNKLAYEMFDKYKAAKEAGFEETSLGYLNTAYDAKPSELSIIDSVAVHLAINGLDKKDIREDYLNKSLKLAQKGVISAPDSSHIRRVLILDLCNLGRMEEAYTQTESLLMFDPYSPLGIYLMCLKNLDAKNWEYLEKWGEKAYDKIAEDNSYKGTCLYYYAKALYERGKTVEARKVFFEANKNHYDKELSVRYAKIGGAPGNILSLGVRNTKYDDTIVTKEGNKLYEQDTYYLCPVFKSTDYRFENFELEIKIYRNGELVKCDEKLYDKGISYVVHEAFWGKFNGNYLCDDELEKATTHEHVLSGWGSDSSGWWKQGDYRLEIWWQGEKLASKLFTIDYKKSSYWY